ncbi:lysylphosphatidylglycerol synthase transmembrane domain-containing protein [Faecalibaculum rodentium]|uniref:lysylphosphatidylglycerol synthase transmembrane domain-containing protein n=1 Tax=Faecalibaculum rodentium TaxID=1702221 RepID=UPI0023F3FE30|nr:lysylphosphatidylglycerol synthase transmembrane domain-containing protein [Faecalibaculum rodentium]
MKKNNYIWNFLLIAALTAGALWFALKDNYQEVMNAIGKISPLGLVVILSWGILFTCVWGLAYKVLAQKYSKHYTWWDGIVVAFTGTFFSGITPSSTGGQFGQAYILKKQGIDYSDGASLLWADFIIYQTTMMVYVTLLFLLKFSYYAQQSGWFTIILAGYVVNVLVILFLYTMALFPTVYISLAHRLAGVLSHFRFIKNPQHMIESWTVQMTSFTREIKKLSRDKGIILQCTGINFIRLTMLYMLPFVIAKFMHIDLHWNQLLDVIALSSFVYMANSFIPIPGASGGTEVLFNIVFSTLLGTLASAVMILWRVSTYHIILVLGGILFMIAKARYEKKEQESPVSLADTNMADLAISELRPDGEPEGTEAQQEAAEGIQPPGSEPGDLSIDDLRPREPSHRAETDTVNAGTDGQLQGGKDENA